MGRRLQASLSILLLFPSITMTLSTEPFKISASTYIRRIMKRWLSRYMLILLAALVTFVILGYAVNTAFFIVALIFIFIGMPTVLMFAYYFYGLTPRIVMLSAGTATLTISADTLHISITLEDKAPQQFSIPLSQIREITPGNPHDIIICGPTPADLILIDKNAFASRSARIQFHNYIFDNIQKKSVNSHP